MAVPQLVEWTTKFTSSSFVAACLQTLGVLGNIAINTSEFTVKDIYQLQIFDTRYEKPDDCIVADPHLNFCQLSGLYRMNLPGYNSIKPYN